ncbi:MAG: MFS transporter [Gaiellaceae bacterium]
MAALRTRIAESLAALRGVYANRDLRRVQLAYAGSSIGAHAFSIVVAVYAFRHGGATAVGVFMFIRLGVAASVAPFASSLADRFRRERVMLGSDLARVVTVGSAAVAVSAHAPALVVYVLATLTSILGTVFRPAASALLPTLARSPQELTAANVSSSTFDSLGSFTGPALGALLLAVSGPTVVFALVAGTFAWSAWFVGRVHSTREASEADIGAEHETFTGLAGGLRAIRAEPRLRLLIGLYGAQCLVAGALGVLVVVTAIDLLGLGNAGVGWLEAISGVGSLAGAALALGLVGRKRLAGDFALGIVLWGAPLMLLGAVPQVAIAGLALGIVGIGNTLVDISAMTLLQRTAPVEAAGRVFGVLETVIVGALALGSLLAPALVAVIGVRGALLAVGALLPVLAALCWRLLSVIDDGAHVPEEQLAALRGVPFLAPLPLQSLEFLAARLVPLHFGSGEVLFTRGDEGDRFYILTEGTLEVLLPEGTKLETAPSFVGEIALLRDVPRTGTVRAATDATLWALERDDFLDAVTRHSSSRTSAEQITLARVGAAMT